MMTGGTPIYFRKPSFIHHDSAVLTITNHGFLPWKPAWRNGNPSSTKNSNHIITNHRYYIPSSWNVLECPSPLGSPGQSSKMKENHCRTPGRVSILELWKFVYNTVSNPSCNRIQHPTQPVPDRACSRRTLLTASISPSAEPSMWDTSLNRQPLLWHPQHLAKTCGCVGQAKQRSFSTLSLCNPPMPSNCPSPGDKVLGQADGEKNNPTLDGQNYACRFGHNPDRSVEYQKGTHLSEHCHVWPQTQKKCWIYPNLRPRKKINKTHTNRYSSQGDSCRIFFVHFVSFNCKKN